MFRRSLQRVILPLVSSLKSNSNNANRFQIQTARQNYGRRKQQVKSPKILISAGLLGWLGLEKQPEKVDENHKASEELLKTIRLGVITIQVGILSIAMFFLMNMVHLLSILGSTRCAGTS